MVKFEPIPGVNYKHDYQEIFRNIAAGKIPRIPTYRELCKKDLFFLLFFGLARTDIHDPARPKQAAFVVNCIREVEGDHTNTLDLWAREHYKSTIITYGLPIQEIIKNPEHRIAIFSHTRPIAKGFLRQIKQTLEANPPVKKWFPDVFYGTPKKQAPKWSEDDGIVVKRKTTPKESTLEAWGVVDGQPTSKHFTIRIYDDVVTKESVTTPEQIKKVADAYELSQSLGTDGGKKRMNGTHYHFADLYAYLRKKGNYKVRIKPAVDESGNPVFLTQERLDELRSEQGAYIFSCQQLLKPVSEEEQDFKPSWLKYYRELPTDMNKYLLVDPANEKKPESDYTSMNVVGIDWLGNRFWIDGVFDKLDLYERWIALKTLVVKHWPILDVGYEKYGMQADVSYIQEKQRDSGFYFNITPLGGQTAKPDRIKRLVPLFEGGRFYLPETLMYKGTDLVKVFVEEEYSFFPFCVHFDMLDCISRIEDPKFYVNTPVLQDEDDYYSHAAQEGRCVATGY